MGVGRGAGLLSKSGSVRLNTCPRQESVTMMMSSGPRPVEGGVGEGLEEEEATACAWSQGLVVSKLE